MLIVAVAGKCPVRGVLADDEGPLTADDLEDKTGLPAASFATAISVLASERFQWLETVDLPEPAEKTADASTPCRSLLENRPTRQDKTEHDTTEQNRTVQDVFSELEEISGTAAGDAVTFLKPMEQLAERIWNAYPKKTQRGLVAPSLDAAILRVINLKGCTDEQAFAWILAAVMEFAASPMGRLSTQDGLPSPSRWLDGDRYRDDRKLWQSVIGDKPKPAKPSMKQIAGVNIDG
jgi:hypothetical protein